MIQPYDVHTNLVWIDMQTAETLMDSVASGRKLIQLICSPSGFGKTTIAKRQFRKYGIVSEQELYRSLPPLFVSAAIPKGIAQSRATAMRRAVGGAPPFENPRKKLFVETRPTKPISLVRILHLCAMLQASALLFDDPGRIAADEASCDILKTAFGAQRMVTYETPEITRNENQRISQHGGYDPFLPPPDFPVPDDLRWLWLANTNYTDAKVLAKFGDHFAPLIARGLNPFWVRDDIEHDHRDLFLYVHYKATQENLLRSMGFKYEVSRKAVNFYITHADRLVDLCPRRLELIAVAFAKDQPPSALEAELNSMAPSVIRPNLKLPASWVKVPDGVLLWPETPFSKEKPTVEGSPRRIRRRERAYKRARIPAASPDPDPEPPPPAASPPVPDPDPALDLLATIREKARDALSKVTPSDQKPPEPDPTPSIPDPSPEPIKLSRAVNAVYRIVRDGGNLTCEIVADVLKRFPLAEWDRDDLDALGEALNGCSAWMEYEALTDAYFRHDPTIKLFASTDEVLIYDPEFGLQILTWAIVEQQLAPALAEQQRRMEQRQREQRGRDILRTRLPKVRKLKAMTALIDELLTCQPTINEQGQHAIAFIRAMSHDDPQYADCTTFARYIEKTKEIIDQNPPTGSEPQVHETNVVEFRPSKPR